jgi:hypothetical protein
MPKHQINGLHRLVRENREEQYCTKIQEYVKKGYMQKKSTKPTKREALRFKMAVYTIRWDSWHQLQSK